MSEWVQGVDYSTARPSPNGLYSAGKRFVVRYGGPGSHDKHLTSVEARALANAGLWIVANAEGTSRGFFGYSAGVVWAQQARIEFRDCGMPDDRPIYFSADWDVSASQWPGVLDALAGAASVIGWRRVGLYAGRWPIEWAKRDGRTRWFWQTYAWSGGYRVPDIHLYQYQNGVKVAGGDCDLNSAMLPDYGQWKPGTTVGTTGKVEETMLLRVKDGGDLTGMPTGYGNGTVYLPTVAGPVGISEPELKSMGAATIIYVDSYSRVTQLAPAVASGPMLGSLTDGDRALLTEVMTAVDSLNNRLASP